MFHHFGANTVGKRLMEKGHQTLGYLLSTVGASGVELFFVLSGVVLVRQYARSGRQLELGLYARRRFERIYPPYVVAWLAAGLAIAVISHAPTWWSATAALPTFQFSPWLQQLPIIYSGAHYNFPCWSLGVEVLFYFFVPLLVPLVARLPDKQVTALVVTSLAAILSFGIERARPAFLPLPLTDLLRHSVCFASGLVLARLDLQRTTALAFGAVGVIVLLLAARVDAHLVHVGYCALYVGLVARALDAESRISRQLGRWHFVWMGERSYSLFLIHGPIILLVYWASSRLFSGPNAAFLLVSRLTAFVLSWLSALLIFGLVERRYARGLVTGNQLLPIEPPSA